MDSWGKFREEFLKYYRSGVRKEIWRTALRTKRQRADESVDSVASEVPTLLERLGIHGKEERIQYFVDALRPELAAQIYRTEPQTLEAAIEIARREELIELRRNGGINEQYHGGQSLNRENLEMQGGYYPHGYPPWAMPPNPWNMPPGPMHSMPNVSAGRLNPVEPNRLEKRLEDLTTMVESLALNALQYTSKAAKAKKESSINRRENDQGRRSGKNVKCRRCQAFGHYASECEAPHPVPRRRDSKEERDKVSVPKASPVVGSDAQTSNLPVNAMEFMLPEEATDLDVLMAEHTTTRVPAEEVRGEAPNQQVGGGMVESPALSRRENEIVNPSELDPVLRLGEAYSIAEDLTTVPANITMGQLLRHSPSVRQELTRLLHRVAFGINAVDLDVGLEEEECDMDHFTAARGQITINNQPIEAISDSGAATSVITKGLLRKLKLSIDRPVHKSLSTVGGGKIQTLGLVTNVPIQVEGITAPVGLLVFDREDDCIILGNNWFKINHAYPDVDRDELVMRRPFGRVVSRLECIDKRRTCDTAECYSLMIAEEQQEKGKEDTTYLSADEQEKLNALLGEYEDIFHGLGRTGTVEHQIETGDAKPIKCTPYRTTWQDQQIIKREIEEMLEQGVIEPAISPWAFPVVLVRKKNGKIRFCVNFQKLNDVTSKDTYPLPHINDILDALHGATVFSTLDAASGYWQVALKEEDRPKATFVTRYGTYQFRVMPFGLCNAPATFQRLMEHVLDGMLWKNVVVFIDDINVYSRTFDEHVEHLRAVFQRLRVHNLKLNRDKCRFGQRQLKYLGHTISAGGVAVDESKMEKLMWMPRPQSIRDVRCFLGLASYYRRFIPKFSNIAMPLHQLTSKDQEWRWREDVEEQAYQTLRAALVKPPVLAYPNPDLDREFHLITDASGEGLGAILEQEQDNGERKVISYASRGLHRSEKNYAITDLEALAVVWAIGHFRHYLAGRHFWLHTDHSALRWVFRSENPTGRMARWSIFLSQFDFTTKHCRAALARTTLEGQGHYRHGLIAKDNGSGFDGFDDNSLDLHLFTTMEQAKYYSIYNYLNSKTYPIDANDKTKQQVRSWARPYAIRDGRLVKRKYTAIPIELLREDNARDVVERVHAEGHFGINNTWNRVRIRYDAPNLFNLVRDVVTRCDTCQRRRRRGPRQAELHPMLIPPQPMEIMGIDAAGPLPQTKKGNRYILVAVDMLSGWPIARAVSNITTETTIDFLIADVVSIYGCPKRLVSDQGSNFTGELVQQFLRRLEIHPTPTSAYRPEANGKVERMNQTLKATIAKMSRGRTDWDDALPLALMAIRAKRHEATGYSPYEVLFGMPMVTPALWTPRTEEEVLGGDPSEAVIPRLEVIKSTLGEVRETAAQNLRSSQLRAAARYNKRVKKVTFRPGDQVMVYDETPESTFHNRWFGPLTITRRAGSDRYHLSRQGRELTIPVHADRLQHYIPPVSRRPIPSVMAATSKDTTEPLSQSRKTIRSMLAPSGRKRREDI
ncbi:uncharacterized protein VTP21DRAFT_11578 [Calcarisporiella thermophila]|uniref:uncharacterized protein n=1 Tax=Calcarisporiella thermophila TaxID=911321 RepID=UPI0037423571